jgi:Reverse transcriptase (RNA-dependent DNA polymerase)
VTGVTAVPRGSTEAVGVPTLELSLTECVVKNRLTQHLSSNNLLNQFQPAYTKHHSTESTLLAVYDHIRKAMSQQQVTALCLLDLSAAFDTIDHSILLHRLSTWFGFNGKLISWLTSYLSFRSFAVTINSVSSAQSSLSHAGCPARISPRSSLIQSVNNSP